MALPQTPCIVCGHNFSEQDVIRDSPIGPQHEACKHQRIKCKTPGCNNESATRGVCVRCYKAAQAAEARERQAQFMRDVEAHKVNSPLPQWIIKAIEELAYEYGHACGESEVANYELGMMETFERHRAAGGGT